MIRAMKCMVIIGFLSCIQLTLLANGLDQIIYNNGGPTSGAPYILSDLDPIGATAPTIHERASNFSIPVGYRITDFHWWGNYVDPSATTDNVAQDDFYIRIFADVNGLPPANYLYNYHIGSASRNALSTYLYEYSAFILPLDLPSNTQYWLSIVNNTTNDLDGWYWKATSYVAGTLGDVGRDNGGSWAYGYGEMAYQITGQPVPEPTSLLLLGTGLGAIGLAVWRRRKA